MFLSCLISVDRASKEEVYRKTKMTKVQSQNKSLLILKCRELDTLPTTDYVLGIVPVARHARVAVVSRAQGQQFHAELLELKW